jgi:elongation factor Ts
LKLLRKKTGAGMLDCTKAISQAKGSADAAEALLKEWGLAGMEKRADRSMSEGRIFARAEASRAAMAEISCETDFVSRNEAFIKAGSRIVDLAFERRLTAADSEIEGLIAGLASSFKENIALKRLVYIAGAAAFVDERVAAFFHDIALHVAAFKPLFLDEERVPEAYLKEKSEEFRKQVEEDEKLRGKAKEILEGAIAGKLRKHLSEVCLLSHGFVRDEKTPVSKALREISEETGFELSISAFAYFRIGEE